MIAPAKPTGANTFFVSSKNSQKQTPTKQDRKKQNELRSKQLQAEVTTSGLLVPEPRGLTRASLAALTTKLVQLISMPSQRSSQEKKPPLKTKKKVHFLKNHRQRRALLMSLLPLHIMLGILELTPFPSNPGQTMSFPSQQMTFLTTTTTWFRFATGAHLFNKPILQLISSK